MEEKVSRADERTVRALVVLDVIVVVVVLTLLLGETVLEEVKV